MRAYLMASVSTLVLLWACHAWADGQAGDLFADSTYECADIYYGIGQPADYAKAYQCFASHSIYQFLIVMQLNGEGVPRDTHKAKELLDAWLKADPDNADSLDETGMAALVDRRVHADGANPPRIDYCKDVSSTTLSMDFCAEVDDRRKRHDFDDTMTEIRSSLDSKSVVIWDEIQEEFAKYQKAEGNRMYLHRQDGTIRTLAYQGQVSYVRGNFLALMSKVFTDKTLEPVTAKESKDLQEQLDAAYRDDIKSFTQDFDYLNGSGNSADEKQEYREHVVEFKNDAEKEQADWLHLRTLCSELVARVYVRPGVDWRASMSAAMDKIRTLDLKNDVD